MIILNVIGTIAGIGLVGLCMIYLIASSSKPTTTVTTKVRYVNCTEQDWIAYDRQRNAKKTLQRAA